MPIDRKLKAKTQHDLGLALKTLRKIKRIPSAEALAELSDFSPSFIADIERGARNPSFAMLAHMAARLNIPLAELAAIYDQQAAVSVPPSDPSAATAKPKANSTTATSKRSASAGKPTKGRRTRAASRSK